MYKNLFFKQIIYMFSIILRAIIVYTIVLIVFRLMGKRQIGQMQPFELVLTLIIADLATTPMSEMSIPLLHGVIPLFTLVIAHYLLTVISKKSIRFNRIISGKPIIVVNPNGIDHMALRELNISVDDVFGAIRAKGYFKLEQIQYAIMETNGTINVMPKSDFAPVVNQDLNLQIEEESLPITLISEGSIMKENLALANVDVEYVKKLLKKAKISSLKNCIVLTIDKKKQVYAQQKGKKFVTFEVQ